MNKWIMNIFLGSAVKKSDIIKFADKWVELEKFIYSEVIKIQIVKHHMFFLMCES